MQRYLMKIVIDIILKNTRHFIYLNPNFKLTIREEKLANKFSILSNINNCY